MTGVGKVRPAGQIWPAVVKNPARERFLNCTHKHTTIWPAINNQSAKQQNMQTIPRSIYCHQ